MIVTRMSLARYYKDWNSPMILSVILEYRARSSN